MSPSSWTQFALGKDHFFFFSFWPIYDRSLNTPKNMDFLVAQLVKNLPVMRETQVQIVSWEDPLEMGMATHSSILAWRIPWTEEPVGLQSMGSQRLRHD